MEGEIVEEYDVTTNEIMSFLKTNMVTKDEFNALVNRVDKMDGRLERVEKAVDTDIPNKLDKLDAKIDGVKYDTATLLKNKDIITKQEGIEYIRGTR